MPLPEPRPLRWELHWRMFGSDFRIQPMFWVSSALLGVIYYQYPQIGGIGPFFFWMAAVLVSLLVHETGHVFMARRFGVHVRIVLGGLGGQVFGMEQLRLWQRLLVLLAGPLLNAMLFGLLWAVTGQPLPFQRLDVASVTFLANAVWVALMINALWAGLNLLPLWPLDGGRLAVEAWEALLGKRGRTLALLASLAVALLLTATVILWMRLSLTNRFDPRYPLYLGYFCILVLYCYVMWLSAFRALWGDETSPDATAGSDRAA